MARLDFVTGNAQRYLRDVEALAAVPDRVESALAGHSTADLSSAAANGEWSPARILGHMISYARHYQERFYLTVWMTDPAFIEYDDEEEARANAWESSDGARLLDSLTEAITTTVDVLKELPHASWGRAGLHPRFGRRSIRQLVQLNLEHYDEHTAQLERVLAGQAGQG